MEGQQMTTSTQSPAGRPVTEIDPALAIGGVSLAVSDLPRSVDFYGRLLGLPLISEDGETASFGFDEGAVLLELTRIIDPVPAPARSAGLFHVAWLHPSRGALADTVQRLARARWPFDGASDHGVSEALYLSDPDGLGIEIYADRPREVWERLPDGHVRMFTVALDLDDLLAQGAGEAPPVIAPGTVVGHVHLKVSDVPRATAFYAGALGFPIQAELPSANFLGAGGYHHHVGVNSWQSAGAEPAPDGAPGLRETRFTLNDGAAIDALERSLANAGSRAAIDEQGVLSVTDSDGQRLIFAAR
jgi:catechol 2,3-dioxygenase